MNARLMIAGACGAAGVCFAAFGAHALPTDMPENLRRAFGTGADFQLLHAVVLAAIALAPARSGLNIAFALILAGSLVFALSLYGLALAGVSALGAVTPIGGGLTILGWLALAVAGARKG